jgi:hypothetical protein
MKTYAEFQKLAADHEGETKDFGQKRYIQRFKRCEFKVAEDVANGMCRALAIAFLVKNYYSAIKSQPDPDDGFVTPDWTKDLITGKFFDALEVGRLKMEREAGEPDAQLFVNLTKLHVASKWRVQPTTAGEARKFDIGSAQLIFDVMSNKRLQNAGDFMIDAYKKVDETHFPSRQGFWLINTNEHGTALCFRTKGDEARARFFDPNFGRATFSDYQKCREFISAYRDETNKTYSSYVQEYS